MLLALLIGVIAAITALIRSLPKTSAERSLTSKGMTVALLSGIGLMVWIDPRLIDPALITILHEGNTEHVIRALWGSGHHGPLWDAVRWAFASLAGYEDVLPIRVIVTLNVSLAAFNLISLMLAARLVIERWNVALLIGLTMCMSPLFINSALSELTAQLIMTLSLAMGAALAALPRARWWSLTALVVLTACLGLTRAELGLAGGLITVAAVAVPYLEARPHGPRWLGPTVALAIGTAAFMSASWFLEGERATYLTQGFTPTDWGPIAMPMVYAMGLGLGLIAMGLMGAVRMFSKSRWIGVPLALILLTRMYTEASHRGQAPYETLRYAQLTLPLLLGCALVGWRAVLSHGRWTAQTRRLSIGCLVALHLIPLGEFVSGSLMAHHHLASEPLYSAPLDRDQQREARALIRLIEEPSNCVAVAVSARDPKPTDPIEGWDYIFFGGPLANPLTVERDAERLDEHLRSLGSPRCARFFSGLDCHVQGYPGCEEERAMGTPGEPSDVGKRPYYDHLTREQQATLEIIRWGDSGSP